MAGWQLTRSLCRWYLILCEPLQTGCTVQAAATVRLSSRRSPPDKGFVRRLHLTRSKRNPPRREKGRAGAKHRTNLYLTKGGPKCNRPGYHSCIVLAMCYSMDGQGLQPERAYVCVNTSTTDRQLAFWRDGAYIREPSILSLGRCITGLGPRHMIWVATSCFPAAWTSA